MISAWWLIPAAIAGAAVGIRLTRMRDWRLIRHALTRPTIANTRPPATELHQPDWNQP